MFFCLFLLPLFGSIVSSFFSRSLGKRGSSFVSSFCVISSCILSFFCCFEVSFCNCPITLQIIPWIDTEFIDSFWCVYIDSLTACILIVITSISSIVHLYSIDYIKSDPYLPRFISYLSFFTFLILCLVLAENYLQLFFGWEGVGLASFLLISFWSHRLQACKAATKAIVINRIGDVGLIIGLFSLYSIFGCFDFEVIFACSSHIVKSSFLFFQFEVDALSIISIFFLIGACGKSAQFGLHTWLPDAIEGPTPVSALIHAATIVTAGVFLLIRSSPLIEYSPTVLFIVSIVGAFTAFFAASIGFVQNDIKRVIAYSTCSQLGYIVFSVGLSQYGLSLFHLMNHAFFKALLFLGAGCVIHALGDEQDLRRMGGLGRMLSFTYSSIVIGTFALIGFPFITGFYSKDIILEVSQVHFNVSGSICNWFGVISVFLTSFYSFRLLFLSFLGFPNGYKTCYKKCHEAPLFIFLGLMPLAGGSIFLGYFSQEIFLGFGSSFWSNSFFVLPAHEFRFNAECSPTIIKQVPLFFTVFGAFLSYTSIYVLKQFFFNQILDFKQWFRNVYIFLNQRWLFDKMYNDLFVKPFFIFSYVYCFKKTDKGILEVFGPFGISIFLVTLSGKFKEIQSGRIYHYIFMIIFGLGFLFFSTMPFTHNWFFFVFSVCCWCLLKILLSIAFLEYLNIL